MAPAMTDADRVDYLVAELKTALRRLHPEIVEFKRVPTGDNILKFALMAFSDS